VATLECAVDAWALDPVLRFDWSETMTLFILFEGLAVLLCRRSIECVKALSGPVAF